MPDVVIHEVGPRDGLQMERVVVPRETREAWIRDVRRMVEEASADGGRAIVLPARTTGEGPEREFLAGLNYALGNGFAPHPLFARWVEEQIRAGAAKLDSESQVQPPARDADPTAERVAAVRQN